MRRLLAGILLLSACAGPQGTFGYEPPETTPYDARPLLKEQYLKAHRAAWNSKVREVTEDWLARVLRGEEGGPYGTHVPCCEATPNVTRGWYRGIDDGKKFIDRIAVPTDRPEKVMEQFLRLKKDLEARPVEDWYVSDSYTPALLVEVPDPNGTVVRVYRDDTRTKLHEIRQVRNGKNHGRVETYDVNGSLRSVEAWIDGVQEGQQISISDSGEVSGWTGYRGGKRDGVEVCFDGDRVLSLLRWAQDRKQGRCLTYQPEGARVVVYDADERKAETFVPTPDLPEEEQPGLLLNGRKLLRP